MSDLLDRLRNADKPAYIPPGGGTFTITAGRTLCQQAADEIERLQAAIDGRHSQIEKLQELVADLIHERDGWHENFLALCHALVGETGLSAIEEAHKLRALHPLSSAEGSK